MSRTPYLRAPAAAEVHEAYAWYESRRVGLGEEFLAAVSDALSVIGESPSTYPVVHRDTRRYLMPRFPYGIYYRVLDNEIVVVACMRGSRSPRRWKRRR